MEQGTVKIGDKNDVAEAGVVMLGNNRPGGHG